MPRAAVVDAWFDKYDNPMKDVVQRLREIILEADPRIQECIKWQAPTFVFAGNLASFFPKSKQHASLMFHEGANIPGEHPLLQGTAALGRSLKLASVDEAEAARDEIRAIVRAWCEWKAPVVACGADLDQPSPAGPRPARSTTRQTAPKKTATKKTATKATATKKAAPKKTAPKKRSGRRKVVT